MKPELTQEQKKKFIEEFKAIVIKAPEEIQNDFREKPNVYFPIDDNPIIESGVQEKLSLKLKSEFTALMNKLKSRTL
jgi:hypothetical protein